MKELIKNILFVLLIFWIISGIFSLISAPPEKEITITQLVEEINQGKVKKIVVSGNNLKIVFQDGTQAKAKKESESALSQTLVNYGVEKDKLAKTEIEVKDTESVWGWLGPFLFSFLPVLIIIFFFWSMLRQAKTGTSQIFDFTRAKPKLVGPGGKMKEKVTFKDVGGLKEAKEELKEVVDFLKNPKKYLELGAKIPRGVLLIGPPGSGKTLLAKAIACEAGVPFFSISGSEFVELFVGVGSARIRDLFSTAKKHQPCLTGDTLITLSNGEEVSIKEMFEKKMVGVEVLSMNEKFKIENAKVLAITERGPEEIYQIKTYHTEIKATKDHKFPVLRDGKLFWIEAKDLTTSDYIAAPRKIKTSNKIPSILKLLPSETRIYLKSKKGEKHKKRNQLYSIKLKDWKAPDFNDIDKIALGKGYGGGSWLFKIPQFLDEKLLYVKGLIDSDGDFPKKMPWCTQFVNTRIELHQKLKEIIKEKFGYEPKTYLNKKCYETVLPQGKKPKKLKDCYTTNINNKIIRTIFEKIDEILLTLPENLISAWLSGIFDGDGYCSNEKNDPKIVIVATDKTLHHRIKSALHRLGIIGYSTRSNEGASIEITGKTNIEKFKEKIFSYHPEKIKRLRELNLTGKNFWRLDQIPIGSLLKEARVSVGMGQQRFHNGHEVWYWERNIHIPSRTNLLKKIEEINNWCLINNLEKTEEIKKLEDICNGEIFWSRITEIKKLPKKEKVYDLSLDKNHNFLANRIFVHNCVIFIDEIDSIGKLRGVGVTGGHEEREQTLNQLLSEMDGIGREENLVVLGATNRPELLDPALLRPGRFDRRIVLDLPDINEREEILKIHCRGKPLASNVNLREIAERTPGFSGADLANVVNEAAILAARRNKNQIFQEELLESIEKVLLGPERKSHVLTKKEKEIAAYHEAGHAIVAASLKGEESVRKISIIPRGLAAGYVLKSPSEERKIKTKSEFLAEMATLLGGYCAEILKFKEISTGAANDLEVATDLAKRLVMEYGMSDLGPITFGKKEELAFLGVREIYRDFSEKVAEKIDKEIEKFVKNAQKRAMEILKRKRKILEKIAQRLIEKETIEKEEFEKLIKERKEKLEIKVKNA